VLLAILPGGAAAPSAMAESSFSVIFDLDGTLVDTAPDLLGALNAILTAEGHEPVVPADLRNLVGHGAKAMFEHALKRTGVEVSTDRMGALTERFLAFYRLNIARGSRPFPGVPKTLEILAEQGMGLGVCTNKAQDLTELLLRELDLFRYFPASVFGGGSTPYSKPDPRHLLEVVRALNGRRERAVLVGDSIVDINTARAADIPVIAMSYGYTPVPVSELGADAVVDDFAALPEVISRLVS
jgi:phosphoglycolate phosphatase